MTSLQETEQETEQETGRNNQSLKRTVQAHFGCRTVLSKVRLTLGKSKSKIGVSTLISKFHVSGRRVCVRN